MPTLPDWLKASELQQECAFSLGIPVGFENSMGMRFVLIPSGTFTMGSPDTEQYREQDEIQHQVKISKPFYMQIAPVTNAQYRSVVPGHDSGEFRGFGLNGNTQPVVNINYEDVAFFLSGMPSSNTVIYRLPTEAEWEFSCRAGTDFARFWGNDDHDASKYANVHDKSLVAAFQDWPHDGFPVDDGFVVSSPVCTFLPNPWGLFDVLGNIWEMCADWRAPYPDSAVVDPVGPATGALKMIRGGDWKGTPAFVRAGNRAQTGPNDRVYVQGFRLVAEII